MATKKTLIAHEDEADIGQDRSITLDSEKTLEQIRDELNSTIETVGEFGAVDRAEELLFMEERVMVHVFESPDKNAEAVVEVFNDGIPQRFVRGQWQICKRKFVEVLARAKTFSVQTPEAIDHNGDRTTRIDKKNGLRYPFEMRDTNPHGRGHAWLSSILAEA